MSATVVFATPTSSCREAAAAAIRSRVACCDSARAFNSYLRFWVDMAFSDDIVSTIGKRDVHSKDTIAMQTSTAPRIVGPRDGKAGSLGSIGVRLMIDTEETFNGGF